jgi:hypothetical protein
LSCRAAAAFNQGLALKQLREWAAALNSLELAHNEVATQEALRQSPMGQVSQQFRPLASIVMFILNVKVK